MVCRAEKKAVTAVCWQRDIMACSERGPGRARAAGGHAQRERRGRGQRRVAVPVLIYPEPAPKSAERSLARTNLPRSPSSASNHEHSLTQNNR
eukprot:2744212-Rhodomonas_salina.1